MSEQNNDFIIIGSGAGGAAAAYNLVKAGRRVLLLEKGDRLPRDGSTLDVKQVFAEGRFKNQQPWVDSQNRQFIPSEFYNVGGKTKWYGAALLRFSPHEFEPDPQHQCPGWPISEKDLAPYYDQAESLMAVTRFDNEPELQQLVERVLASDSAWRADSLPLGLKREILEHPEEAKHFDGFASACGFKSDAEWNLLDDLQGEADFTLLPGQTVTGLLPTKDDPAHIIGVVCADGRRHLAGGVILAAGAMSSPRLLQDYLEASGLAEHLPSTALVGANFKLHVNSALLGFSPFKKSDVLRKTAFFLNDKFPHSTVQCLGWMDGEILATQLPAAVPKFVARAMGARAYGFFVTTEDGSHPDNRVISCGGHGGVPVLDYEIDRLPPAQAEHRHIIQAFGAGLRKAGMLGVSRYVGLAGTAHALGSLITGADPKTSVVDADGQVHGIQGLFVADGSVLPRSSRVNPALTIYAWGLRLGARLGRREIGNAG
ncbi:MAG: GMC family oxidoreductase [Candidatus Accumulibacter meliphilus]|jgi:choline dehydrogenase-like flavoprotein|uniref:GMC family oxidoreductase n=1 Tax=Candidatus Accumulibacter meliphilus TaxID=2211374 RepID=UPI002FC3779A